MHHFNETETQWTYRGPWAFYLGKVVLDVVGLGVDPPCFRVSEETLLTLIDERAQLARAAPGVTPVDSSEEGAPVRELIRPSVLGEPLRNGWSTRFRRQLQYGSH